MINPEERYGPLCIAPPDDFPRQSYHSRMNENTRRYSSVYVLSRPQNVTEGAEKRQNFGIAGRCGGTPKREPKAVTAV